jgi:hypothetical protein
MLKACGAFQSSYLIVIHVTHLPQKEPTLMGPKEERQSIHQYLTISHPDIRVKHGSIWAFTSIAVTHYTDVLVYKMESCSKTLFSMKAL